MRLHSVPADKVGQIASLRRMHAARDERIITRDAAGCYRFNAEFRNVGDLSVRLAELSATYGEDVENST